MLSDSRAPVVLNEIYIFISVGGQTNSTINIGMTWPVINKRFGLREVTTLHNIYTRIEPSKLRQSSSITYTPCFTRCHFPFVPPRLHATPRCGRRRLGSVERLDAVLDDVCRRHKEPVPRVRLAAATLRCEILSGERECVSIFGVSQWLLFIFGSGIQCVHLEFGSHRVVNLVARAIKTHTCASWARLRLRYK